MPAQWQTVRVFISSTFRDMQAERDHLVKVVFPQLRESLERDRIHLVDIDLRWGVTAEQADNDLVLDLCLKQIDTCRPFFVGILGERYGWVPKDFPLEARRNFGWIQHHTGKSLTELEMMYGVLNDPKMYDRAMFFLRDATFVSQLSPEQRKVYCEGPTADELSDLPPDQAEACAEDRRRKLRALKETIVGLGSQLFVSENYPCRWDAEALDPAEQTLGRLAGLEGFGQQVRERLERTIRTAPDLEEHFAALANPPADPHGLLEERGYHERFAESRLQIYVGRDEIHRKLVERLEDDSSKPLLLTGRSGSGKSAILARLDRDFAADHGDTFVLAHFVGASPGSTGMHQMLRRFCLELRQRFGLTQTVKTENQQEEVQPYDVPTDPLKLIPAFCEMLKLVPPDEQVVFIIDAVNQLDDYGGAQDMNWLPLVLPANVNILVSCIEAEDRPVKALDALRRRATPEEKVAPLTNDERFDIVSQVPSLSAKTLDAHQTGLLLGNPATRNPLYLIVALEELRGYGRFGTRGELLEQKIASFPQVEGEAGLNALFAQVIERLEAEVGLDVVRPALELIACSRMGLSETELSETLVRLAKTAGDQWTLRPPDPPDTQLDTAETGRRKRLVGNMQVMLRQLRPYLLQRGSLVDFYHRNLFKAARVRYFESEADTCAVHARLADYFADQEWFLESSEEHRASAKQPGPAPHMVNLRKVNELPHQRLRAERWDDMVALFTDLLFIEAKCTAGLVHDLVRDYNEALAVLPEFFEETDRTWRRDGAMRRYNQSLREYAVRRSEWHDRQERGEDWPEPAYPLLPAELRARQDAALSEEHSERAARLRQFANFVSGHLGLLTDWPGEMLPVAYNDTEQGPVSAGAERILETRNMPWLRRSPRPPALPFRPQCLRTLEGHTGTVRRVSVSPDGRRAVSTGDDKTLRVWDLETGACLRTLEGHTGGVGSVSPDGRRAVFSATGDYTLRVWDLETGVCLRTLEGHTSMVYSVSVSPDGRRAVSAGGDYASRDSASRDSALWVWDLETGACLRTLEGHTHVVWSVSVSPDGRRAVSASEDKTLRVWDLETGAHLRTLEGHTRGVSSVSVSPDGRRAVSGSSDKTLRIWDLETGACLRSLQGHTLVVCSVSVSPDGRRAVSASSDKTLRIWDLDTGACLRTLEGHTDHVYGVSVSPDGCRAVSASVDETLRVWDLETGACLRSLEGHTDWVSSVSVSPDGRRAVSAGGWSDTTLRVWDLETGACLHSLEGHTGSVRSVSVSPDGRRAVSASVDEPLRVWDLETGACLRSLEGHTYVCSVSVSPDGRRAVSAGWDKTLRIWDLETGACLRTLEGHTDWVYSVSVSPDGRRAVSASKDKTLRVWDLETGACLRTLEGHTSEVCSVSVSPDGRRAVSVGGCYNAGWWSKAKALRVWDLETGACLRSLEGHTGGVESVSMSPDGRRAVSGSEDKTLRVWDLETGTCLRTLEGHTRRVESVSVSPDGRRAVSASADQTLRVWDLETGECLAVYHAGSEGRTTSVRSRSVAIAPIGERIVYGTADGQVHFLAPVNFPPAGPVILTAVTVPPENSIRPATRRGERSGRATCRCTACGTEFAPADEIISAIRALSGDMGPDQSPCLDLPAAAFDDPRLLSACPHCNKPLKFNPFLITLKADPEARA